MSDGDRDSGENSRRLPTMNRNRPVDRRLSDRQTQEIVRRMQEIRRSYSGSGRNSQGQLNQEQPSSSNTARNHEERSRREVAARLDRATEGQRSIEPQVQRQSTRSQLNEEEQISRSPFESGRLEESESIPQVSLPSQSLSETIIGIHELRTDEEGLNQEAVSRFWNDMQQSQSRDPLDLQLEFNRRFSSRGFSPSIEASRRTIQSIRQRHIRGYREDSQSTRSARSTIRETVELYQTRDVGHFVGVLTGIALGILDWIDDIEELLQAIRDVDFQELASILEELKEAIAENPELLLELPPELIRSIYEDIAQHLNQAVENSDRTVDSSAHMMRAVVKIIGLIGILKSALRTVRNAPQSIRNLNDRLSNLKDRLRDRRRQRIVVGVGANGPGIGLVPAPLSQLTRIRRSLRGKLARHRITGRYRPISDYIEKLLTEPRRIRIAGSGYRFEKRVLTREEVEKLLDAAFHFYRTTGGRRLSKDTDTFKELLELFVKTRHLTYSGVASITRPAAGELSVLVHFLGRSGIRKIELIRPHGRTSPDFKITNANGRVHRVEVTTIDSAWWHGRPRTVEMLTNAIKNKIQGGQLTARLPGRNSRTPRRGDIAIVLPSDPAFHDLIDQAMQNFVFPSEVLRIHFFSGSNVFTFSPQ